MKDMEGPGGAPKPRRGASPIIDIEIERHYRLELERPILERIKFRVERGEHWVVIGANGSGKSTLLAILSGELWPSLGTVRVLGAEYGRIDKRELRRRFGVVGSVLSARLHEEDTGLEIAASGLRATIGSFGPLEASELELGARALERMGASSCAARPYGVLSQGERQRVMIARALVNEPELLILDEPCVGLDPVARERFLEDLAALAAHPDGPTQIHVTHQLEEIPPHVTHALVLYEGRTLASGPASSVLSSETLSSAFGSPCRVEVETGRRGPRYRLRVSP
jgi:iron complex transport system ATP-binding protein